MLCIVGAGGFASEVLCLLCDLKRENEVYCFFQSDNLFVSDTHILGIKVLPLSTFDPDTQTLIVAIANPLIRQKIVEQLPQNTQFETLIHPNAIASRWVSVGVGSIICTGVSLTSNIVLGKHTHLNLYTTVGHDCQLGDYFTTAPAVNIGGQCTIGNRVYVGSGACIRQQITIADDVTLGMGSIVVKNISQKGIYAGNPAKKLIKQQKI